MFRHRLQVGKIVAIDKGLGIEIRANIGIPPVDRDRPGASSLGELLSEVTGIALILKGDHKFVSPLKSDLIFDG